MALIEKACSKCGKLNYDSETGVYNEEHVVNAKTGATEKCDTNGTKYVDGIISND